MSERSVLSSFFRFRVNDTECTPPSITRQSRHGTGDSVRLPFFVVMTMSTDSLPDLVSKSFVIAATEHLHRRIARMSDRIRQLEDALAMLQASTSKEPHPLLSEDAIVVDADNVDKPHESEDEVSGEVSRALGTLSVSDQGLSRFFGSTGGSDLLLVCCPLGECLARFLNVVSA